MLVYVLFQQLVNLLPLYFFPRTSFVNFEAKRTADLNQSSEEGILIVTNVNECGVQSLDYLFNGA